MNKSHQYRNLRQLKTLAGFKFYARNSNWYKNKLTDLTGQNIPLDRNVFGITSFGEPDCNQNLQLFSQGAHAMCPKGYPSISFFIE